MILKITDELKEEIPYTCRYFEIYGKETGKDTYELNDLPRSTIDLPSKYRGRPELLYKDCVKKGKKWSDIIKEPDDNAIL